MWLCEPGASERGCRGTTHCVLIRDQGLIQQPLGSVGMIKCRVLGPGLMDKCFPKALSGKGLRATTQPCHQLISGLPPEPPGYICTTKCPPDTLLKAGWRSVLFSCRPHPPPMVSQAWTYRSSSQTLGTPEAMPSSCCRKLTLSPSSCLSLLPQLRSGNLGVAKQGSSDPTV